MTEMTRLDIQLVQRIMENCLAKRPCTSRTTQFYVVGDPEYNIAVTHPQSTSTPNKNTLFTFRLSADVLKLNLTTCIERKGTFLSHRAYGPMGFSRVVIEADVVNTRGRFRLLNSQFGFGESLSYPVNPDKRDFHSLVQMFAEYVDENC
uniref:BPH_3 domain-containing protein n=1 Tax=Mesocestoides corti TaxID=53468 RepID=A0A5K3FTK1_MESCO